MAGTVQRWWMLLAHRSVPLEHKGQIPMCLRKDSTVPPGHVADGSALTKKSWSQTAEFDGTCLSAASGASVSAIAKMPDAKFIPEAPNTLIKPTGEAGSA